MDDRDLTDHVGRLLQWADLDADGRLGSDVVAGWGPGVVEALHALGMLTRGTNEQGLICDECEHACWLVPKLTRDAAGHSVLISPCRMGLDVGLLVFSPDRLVTWRLNGVGLGDALIATLDLVGRVEEIEPGWAWSLGEGTVAGRRRIVFLAVGLCGAVGVVRWASLRRRLPPDDVVVLVPWRAPDGLAGDDVAMVSLVDVLQVREAQLRVDGHRLARALGGPKPTSMPGAGDERLAEVRTWHAAPGSQWNQVKVWLVDGDTVRLIVPGRAPRSFTAAELGLAHRRSTTRQRTKGWALLEKLGDGHGTCAWRASGARSFDAFKVQVSELGKVLRHVIGIDASPFHPLNQKNGLRARFVIGPLPEDEPYVGEDGW